MTTKTISLLKSVALMLLLSLCLPFSLLATDFYWTGSSPNTDNWGDPLNWVDVNGTLLNAVPTASDNVFIMEGANYFTGATNLTIDGTVQCLDLLVDVPSGTVLSGSNSPDLSIYGSYTGDSDASIPVNVAFRANSGSHNLIMNGSCFGDYLTFNGINGTWTFQDDFTCGSTVVGLSMGNLIFGSNILTMERLNSSNSNTRSLDISNSIIHIQRGIGVNGTHSWDMETTAGLTWNATGSEIHLNDDNPAVHHQTTFHSGGLIYDKVYFHNVNTTSKLLGNDATFNELHLDGGLYFEGNNYTVDNLYMAGGKSYTFQPNNMLFVNIYWEITGNCEGYTTLSSTLSGLGNEANIEFSGNPNNLNLDYVIIESVDMTGVPYTGSGVIVNMSNSSGWPATNITGSNFYWVGGTGNWSDPNHWSIGTSGGAGNGTCIPGPLDNVIFDGASLNNGESCTIDIPNAYAHDMDWRASNAGAIFDNTSNLNANNLSLYGSLLLSGTMTFSYDGYMRLKYNNGLASYASSILSNGIIFSCIISMEGQNGVYQLVDYFHSTNYLYHKAGIFSTQSYNMKVAYFNSAVRNHRTIDLGNSLIEITGIWDIHLHTYPFTQDNTLNLIEGNSTIRMLNVNFGGPFDWGETYWNLEFTDPNTTGIVYGANTFNDLSFYGNGTITGQTTINNVLLFSPGKSYNISNNVAFGSSGTLDANGTCTSYISINNGGLTKASGAITASFAIIEDNNASGGASFNASSSSLSGTTGDWTVSPGNTQDFHFKATVSENWGDEQNWYFDAAFTNPTNCLPGPDNDVFFYGNSFDVTYPNLLIDELNPFCHSMTWVPGTYSTTPTVTSSNPSNHLRIYGSIQLQGNSDMDWQYTGGLSFKSNDATPHSITSNGQIFNSGASFYGSDLAIWNLTDQFDNNSMHIVQGKLNSNGQTINTGLIKSTGYRIRTLDFTGSTINITTDQTYAWQTTWQGSSNYLTVIMDGSELYLDHVSNSNSWLSAENVDFNEVYFGSNNSQISGSSISFQLAEFSGDGSFTSDADFHILRLTPGKSYSLSVGTTQRIIPDGNGNPGLFDATGTIGTGKINIYSSSLGTQANIEQVSGEICVDYLNLTDIAVTQPGAGTLAFAGQNSVNISNNTGWSFDACTPTLLEGCAGVDINFNTLINGSSFDWHFGDGQTGTGSPILHTYTAAGTYNAYVIISTFNQGSYTEDGRNFQVEVTESCCFTDDDPNYVHKSGTISLYENWPDKVFVDGDIYVTGTAELDITNSDVVFASGARIYFQDQAKLTATNSTFRPCAIGDSWSGLHFDGNAIGNVTDNILINAETGIFASTDGKVESSDNQFLNNLVAFQVEIETNINLEHNFSGNTITVNKNNPFSESGNPINFSGIKLNGIVLENSISQNSFIYSSASSTIDMVYGIHNIGAGVTISDNSFTNISFPYFQTASIAACSFENNSVNYNSEALDIYSSLSDITAVTIEANANPTLVANNEINMSYEISQSNRAIYLSDVSNVVVHENEIEGFYYGIFAQTTGGLFNHNEINHTNYGIYLTEADNLDVNDNQIKSSKEFGIYIENSFAGLRVLRNTIKNNPNAETSGIKYYIDILGDTEAVEFVENCVLDASIAMEFTNESQNDCMVIPHIRGNYLFSYEYSGLFVNRFEGFVGVNSQDPGRNSFLSNNRPNAVDVYYDAAGAQCNGLFLINNWPDNMNSGGPDFADIQFPDGALHSHSTCGNQDIPSMLRLKLLPVMKDYITNNYPMEFQVGNYDIQEGFKSYMQNVVSVERLEQFILMASIFVQNEQNTKADELISLSEDLLSPNEKLWLRAEVEILKGNCLTAQTMIGTISNLPNNDADWVAVNKMKLNYLLNGSLNQSERSELLTIEHNGGVASDLARDIIHYNGGNRPYRYQNPSTHKSSLVAISSKVRNEEGKITVYPNPAKNKVSILYSIVKEDILLTIYNAQGKLLKNERLVPGISRFELDVSHYDSGVYLINITTNGKVLQTERLVVQ